MVIIRENSKILNNRNQSTEIFSVNSENMSEVESEGMLWGVLLFGFL